MITIHCPKDECTGGLWRKMVGGVLRVNLFRDSDGDPGVINGTRSWWDLEVDSQTCTCEYSDDEWDKLIEIALDVVQNREA
jgi:hypothetical protein